MSERRVVRTRILAARPSGSATSALSRRVGRTPPPAKAVVEYEGEDSDSPVLGLLKAVPLDRQKFREGENTHVSDVISKCVRKIAILRRAGMSHPEETLYDGHAITYAIGEALHNYIKAKFVRGHPDKIWARWTCPCRRTEYIGTFATRPEKTCETCTLPVDVHNEVSMVDGTYKLSGSPDLLLWLEQYAAMYLVEIKSMTGNMFKELARPLPDHLIQIAFYWHVLQTAKIPVVDRASILYANKEFSFKLPYKEFMIQPSEVDLGPYWEDLEALKRADAGGPLPPRIMCGTMQAPEARKCPVCVTCFGCE